MIEKLSNRYANFLYDKIVSKCKFRYQSVVSLFVSGLHMGIFSLFYGIPYTYISIYYATCDVPIKHIANCNILLVFLGAFLSVYFMFFCSFSQILDQIIEKANPYKHKAIK